MLFNRIIGRKQSIVEDTPGVTRDRMYAESDWRGRHFTVIDTGGINRTTTTRSCSQYAPASRNSHRDVRM